MMVMFDLDNIINIAPYSLVQSVKEALYGDVLTILTRHHYENCMPYRKVLDALGFNCATQHSIEEMPFIPVRLFKDYELLSVERSTVIKTMMSSGTTGQKVAKIFIDRRTALYQTKVLMKIMASFIGPKRLPLLIFDTRSVVKDRAAFSARGAGILGFSMLGYDVAYAFDENMQLDINSVMMFLEKHKNEGILLFGFTYMIWEYFYQKLLKLRLTFPLERGILIHGGGWKKLSALAVTHEDFKIVLKKVCGIKRVFNYYGMVEQAGSIFMECEKGYLHSSIFSDIIIRDENFTVCAKQKVGLVQLLSLLPLSYPGHNILTEDLGEMIGIDDCPCGRGGKYFKIHGRIKNSELRGCSDTFT